MNHRGFITLLSVVIVGAITLTIVLSLSFLATSTAKNTTVLVQSNQAQALANACAEYALDLIRQTPIYVGTSNLTLSTGTCSATVTNTGGSTRQVVSTGNVGSVLRKVKIIVSAITPRLTLSSWREVADF
jgi:hypothetical protein